MLPDLDRITLAILGLHNGQGSTVMHAHAGGPMCRYMSYHPDDPVSDHPDELYYWPVISIRESGGHWHATRIRGQNGMNDEDTLRLEVIPPLNRGTAWIEVLAAWIEVLAAWIEVLAAGHSAQARATPPSWQ